MQFRKTRLFFIFSLISFATLSGVLTGCAGDASTTTDSYQMAPLDQMPAEVQEAPLVVQESYQFALANPEILTELPCYCGCGSMGHTSNYSCYVQEGSSDGDIKYDNHALGCSICVDITQDAMRLIEEGNSLSEIRTYVDNTYSKYGPSNIAEGQ